MRHPGRLVERNCTVEIRPIDAAVRVDKMTLAALEATLRLALDADLARQRIPLWSFLQTPLEAARTSRPALAEAFIGELGLCASVVETSALLGAGSVPVSPIASRAVRIGPPFPASVASESALARVLRVGDPSVVARVQGGAVLFDLRSLPADDDKQLLNAVRRAVSDRE